MLEALIGGGLVWYVLKSGATGKIRSVVSDFKQGYLDEMAQHRQQVQPNSSESKAAYDFVMRNMIRNATLEDLRPIAELFSKYTPRDE